MVELADTLASGASERTLMGVQVPLRARASDFEQCREIASVSDKRKTACPFFASRLNQNPSSAQDLCASPMREKRLGRFSTLDLIRANPSSKYIFKFSGILIAIKKRFGT